MAEKDRNIRPRDKEIRVKVSDSELQYAKEKAAYCNLSMSEYIRKVIFEGAIIKYEAFNITELAKQLNEINISLHKIAYNIDEDGDLDKRNDVTNLMEEFDKMQEIVYSKIYGV